MVYYVFLKEQEMIVPDFSKTFNPFKLTSTAYPLKS